MKNNWKSLLAGVLALVMLLSCTAALAAEALHRRRSMRSAC